MGTIIAIIIFLIIAGSIISAVLGFLKDLFWDSGVLPVMLAIIGVLLFLRLLFQFWDVTKWILIVAVILSIIYGISALMKLIGIAIAAHECGLISQKVLHLTTPIHTGLQLFNVLSIKDSKGNEYFLSKPFYEKLNRGLDEKGILDRTKFLALCQECATGFKDAELSVLLNYMRTQKDVFSLFSANKAWHLSRRLRQAYEETFHCRGAATISEFQEICAKESFLKGHPVADDIPRLILDSLVREHKADSIRLDTGQTLYCSKESRPGSHLIREEIKLK